jgi:transcription elongation factor Elf1
MTIVSKLENDVKIWDENDRDLRYVNAYSATGICLNCGHRYALIVKKGILLKDLSNGNIKCRNCEAGHLVVTADEGNRSR